MLWCMAMKPRSFICQATAILAALALFILSNSGKILEKGQWIAVSIFGLHHDKKIWGPSVEDFIPERWLSTDSEQKRLKDGYFGFGGGPRHCPGERFALLEVKITLIRIFQNFNLHLGPHQVATVTAPTPAYQLHDRERCLVQHVVL